MKGKVIVYSGPSGVGKGAIQRKLFQDESLNLAFSVSATSRQPRDREENGVHYYFLTKEEFESKIKQGELLEWAEYAGNYYGTLVEEIESKTNAGYNVLLDIEIEGVKQVIEKMPEAVTIYVLPPSLEELERRLTKRGTESPEVIEERMKATEYQMSFKDICKYQVVNDNLNRCVQEMTDIIKKEIA